MTVAPDINSPRINFLNLCLEAFATAPDISCPIITLSNHRTVCPRPLLSVILWLFWEVLVSYHMSHYCLAADWAESFSVVLGTRRSVFVDRQVRRSYQASGWILLVTPSARAVVTVISTHYTCTLFRIALLSALILSWWKKIPPRHHFLSPPRIFNTQSASPGMPLDAPALISITL